MVRKDRIFHVLILPEKKEEEEKRFSCYIKKSSRPKALNCLSNENQGFNLIETGNLLICLVSILHKMSQEWKKHSTPWLHVFHLGTVVNQWHKNYDSDSQGFMSQTGGTNPINFTDSGQNKPPKPCYEPSCTHWLSKPCQRTRVRIRAATDSYKLRDDNTYCM